MPSMRIWRWELAIQAIRYTEPNLEFLLNMLAKIDQELYDNNQRHTEMAKNPPSAKLSEWFTVQESIGMSYLWVLGAYEAIRTLDQRFRDMNSAAAQRHQASTKLKHLYERQRVPLAKLEPSNRHCATDYAFPRPGIDEGHGIAWEVACDVVISRSQLSDDFLSLLESLQNGTLAN